MVTTRVFLFGLKVTTHVILFALKVTTHILLFVSKVTTHVCSTATVIFSDHVIDQCRVQDVGRFSAYLDGSIHIVFDDRTCLDMHGISWESHVYQKLLHSLVGSFII